MAKALHFGAGNIGRGLTGALLAESGYHIIFTDVITHLIEAINKRGTYDVHIVGDNAQVQTVTSISGVLSTSDGVIQAIADPNVRLITTAVGPNILSKIAPTIAKGLRARQQAGVGAINVIACENMVGQTKYLSGFVYQHVLPEDKSWVDQNVGFANCSVDRIVPPTQQTWENPLDVDVEGFYEWVVDETSLKAPVEPKVLGMQLTKDLGRYVERKLFTLNCGHAIAAYLGHLKRYQTIDKAIQDPDIRVIVCGALAEGGKGLIKKHDFDSFEHAKYVEKVLARFENPLMKDDVVRVGRQPLRKLGKGDRLLGPILIAREYGLPTDYLMQGVAAAFLFDAKEDEESVQLQVKITKEGISKTITEITGFSEGSAEHGQVLAAYDKLSQK
jgi:mannitol-1-phosphate 5-dehydrogenase